MKIGIQTKIAGLITIPLLAFIVMAAISIKSDWQQLKIAQKTLEGTELFASVSDVVHALQKEKIFCCSSWIGGLQKRWRYSERLRTACSQSLG